MLVISEVHRRYTRQINFSKEWKGHLWQGNFAYIYWMSPIYWPVSGILKSGKS